MRPLKVLALAILAVTSVALTTASVFAYMGRSGLFAPYTPYTGTTGTYPNNPSGANSYGTTPYGTYPSGTPTDGGYYGGMMVGRGMMGRGCGGMRAGYNYGPSTYTNPTTATPLDINTAVTIAQNYLASTGNTDLAVAQVEEYSLNFYVLVKEKDTGIGAFELLIDRYAGTITAEMGANMMWNTKYGMMNGMCRQIATPTTPMTVTADQANAMAQQFLSTYYSGTTVGSILPFYGYYHVEVLLSGNTYGMLSVNGYTGQVWYHTWHGTFIQELELS